MGRLLIAEDNPFVAAFVQEAAREGGYEVCGVASSGEQLRELAQQQKADLAIIDVRLARGTSGLEAAVDISRYIKLGILYVTGNPHQVIDPPAPVGNACLSKPFTGPELLSAIRAVERIANGHPPADVPPKLQVIHRASARKTAESA